MEDKGKDAPTNVKPITLNRGLTKDRLHELFEMTNQNVIEMKEQMVAQGRNLVNEIGEIKKEIGELKKEINQINKNNKSDWGTVDWEGNDWKSVSEPNQTKLDNQAKLDEILKRTEKLENLNQWRLVGKAGNQGAKYHNHKQANSANDYNVPVENRYNILLDLDFKLAHDLYGSKPDELTEEEKK